MEPLRDRTQGWLVHVRDREGELLAAETGDAVTGPGDSSRVWTTVRRATSAWARWTQSLRT